MDNYVYNVCSLCFNRSYGNDTSLTTTRCFSTEEHVNSEQIQVVVRYGRLISPQDQQNNTYGYFGGYPPAMPQNQYYYYPQMAYYQQMYRYPHLSQVYPHRPQVYLNEPIRHNYPHYNQGYPRPPNRRSYVKPVVNNVMQGSYEERKLNPPPLSDAKLPLTVECYRRKFRALLYYEEEEHVSLLAKNCNGCYPISIVTNTEQFRHKGTEYDYYFCIHGLSPSQILYASQASGEVHVICSSSQYRHIKAKIIMNYDHSNDMLHIGVDRTNGMRLCETITSAQQSFQMKFEVKHSYFNRLHQSLNQITKEALKRIIPSDEDYKEGLDPIPVIAFPDDKLDVFQCNALKTMAFSRCTAPVLIPGPFGSGKTRLLSVASEYLNAIAKSQSKRCRILLCCCQQDSADIFMRDYFLKMLRNGWNVEVVRIVSFLHKRGPASQYVKTLDQLKQEIHCYLLVDHLVVITTFMTALNLPNVFPQGFFTHILIDEGAQAREPECIAPLCMADKNTRIIIAGDSKQVGPKLIVLGQFPQENGLGESLLERLYNVYAKIERAKSYSVTLCNNYRCLPEILDLSSVLFYESSLNACAKIARIRKYSLGFICSNESKHIVSLCENHTEADIIVSEVESLITSEHVDTTGMCIMSPSQRQASLIREKLWKNKLRGIKVLTSYQMQGQEFDILFLSTVENVLSDGRPFDPLKSLCHPAVFNTAITRARSLVIAVGNPSTLINSEEAMGSSLGCWKEFISRCKKNGTYTAQNDSTNRGNIITQDDTKIVKRSFLHAQPAVSRDDSYTRWTDRTPIKLSALKSYHPTRTSEQRSRSAHSTKTSDPHNITQHNRSRGRSNYETKNYTDEDFPTLQVSKELSIKETKKEKRNARSESSSQYDIKPQKYVGTTDMFKDDLTRENYKEKFHQLLSLEEKEHEVILKEKCDGLYTFHLCSPKTRVPLHCRADKKHNHVRFGYVSAKHLDGDKVAYAKQASEGVTLVITANSDHKKVKKIELRSLELKRLEIVGIEPAKGYERIHLGLKEGDVVLLLSMFPHVRDLDINFTDVSVKFVLKHSYFSRLHSGIDMLSDEVINTKLVPNDRSNFAYNTFGSQSTQMVPCVKQIVSLEKGEDMRSNPQMYALHTILNCDRSKAPILVIGSFGTGKTRLLARTAYQILHNNRQAKVLICAHHQKSIDKMLENYFGQMIEEGWRFGELVRLIPKGRYGRNPRYDQYYLTKKQLRDNPDIKREHLRLVLTTFSSAILLSYLGKYHFTHILLDEGAQSREPESIIPFCLASAKTKIVIAGDHKQIGPAVLVLGEEARENGLKISLLERLYSLYDKDELSDVSSESHCITLLTNFRSHHALLSLPSYLFYGSALVTVAEATTQLHPDAQYPLHFVCSSLDDEVIAVEDSVHVREVDMILQQVRKYVTYWPEKEWGCRDLKNICIMATTANQKSLFLGKLKKAEHKDIKDVEVLSVFDIQGQEFQAVFLSTAEPIDKNGMSKNPTKSPCGQFVFNTAITRAKSLFVCAGNPFLLLKTAEKMKNEQMFWRDYMKRCIIAKTYHVHDSDLPATQSITETYKNLQIQIFSNSCDSSGKSIAEGGIEQNYGNDLIINRLQEYVKRRPHYRRCKLQIQEQQQSDQIWKTVEANDDDSNGEQNSFNFIEKVDCELIIKSQRTALGVPIDSNQEPIAINGSRNRRGAFHGDTVTVGVIDKHDGQRYGEIIDIKEGRHPVKYVCRADRQSIINFYPVDKLDPAIVNLPKISRYTLQYKPEVFSESQKSYITVFEESSLSVKNDDILPRIKELIPLEMAPSLLFIVKVLSWSPKYRKPLGAVIEVLPRTTSMFITEKLLVVAHNIQQQEDDINLCELANNVADTTLDSSSVLPLYNKAFTIDPQDAENLDDALNIEQLTENTWKVSVLITDVAKHIKQDSVLDKRALHRGTSVNGLQSKCSHMLPLNFTRANLSLLPDQLRDVLAVSAMVKIKDGEIIEIEKINRPVNARMRSITRLTYEEAQSILNGKIIVPGPMKKAKQVFNFIEIMNSLKLLLKFAMKLRTNRIGDAAYYCETDLGGENNWQSHLLVSELMIWANNEIAKYLNDNIPNLCIFRRQLSPLPDELNKIREIHKDAFISSMSLKSSLSLADTETTPELLIPLSLCAELKHAYDRRDCAKLRTLLSDDNYYPKLAIAEAAMRSIRRRAEYVKGISSKDDNTDSYLQNKLFRHDGLNIDYYTHFTSPIRRYPDIIIQRLVNALLNQSDISYTEGEIKQLCTHFNRKLKSASNFERDVKRVELATSFEDSLDKLEVYLTKSPIKEHQFELCIPSKKYQGIMRGEDTNFDVSQLNCLRRNGTNVTWRIICLPFESPDFLIKSPNIPEFDRTNTATSDSNTAANINVNVFSILDGDEQKDSSNQRQQKISYAAKIQDNTQRMELDTWKQCNEFVKQYSLSQNSNHISLLEHAVHVWNCPPVASIPTATPAHFLETPIICYDATRKLDIGETVTVWMGKDITKPVSSPGIHLIEVAPTVNVCLEHNKSPAMCFSDIQLRLTSKSSYRSVQEYVELWCKALLAEASCDSVKTKTLVILKDAPLKWPELSRANNCLDNVYFVPKNSLSLEIKEERLYLLDFILKVKIRPGDLVCARYSVPDPAKGKEPPNELRAVYHFVIHRVHSNDKKGNKQKGAVKTVYMKPVGEHGCRVSLSWMKILKNSDALPCELQIIKMADSFNRLFHRLQCMEGNMPSQKPHEVWSDLAVNVALGNRILPMQNNYLHVLQSNPNCFQLWSDRNKKLNDKQKRAIKVALENSFSLIQGPPGTGKSIVGAHLAYTFAISNRISKIGQCVLYCGPSNKAVDVVHDYFQVLKKNSSDGLSILRLYGRTHEKLDFKDPLYELKMDEEDTESKCQERFKQDALHWKVRQMEDGEIAKTELRFKDMLNQNIIPSIEERNRMKKITNDLEKKVLKGSYDIILCTCNETCSKRLLDALNGKIAQCIIDECGMAHEPETLAALSLTEHAVLIGDHKQLQPVVKYPPARQCGLTRSLFERYAEQSQVSFILTELNFQYRMHRKICEVPSDLYYEGKLIPDRSIDLRRTSMDTLPMFWPRSTSCPIMFCNVVGKEIDNRSSTVFKGAIDAHSKSNRTEAFKTMEIIKCLVEKHNLNALGKDIAVITPYAAQKTIVQEMLKKSGNPRIEKVVVSSIIESQGDEYNIVILNTVRSLPLHDISDRKFVQADTRWMRDNLGFLTDPHQINVGLTRAKHGLIIIGNQVLLEYDGNWKEIIKRYSENLCIVGEDYRFN